MVVEIKKTMRHKLNFLMARRYRDLKKEKKTEF